MEGPAIFVTRAAVFLTALTFLVNVAPADARRSLVLTETGARAGDTVHFSISGVDGNATYELTVEDRKVAEGAGSGDFSGAFTVPDLGASVRTVKVEAEIRESGKRKKAKERLDYLGPGATVSIPDPPAPAPSPDAAVVVPPADPSPAPVYTTNAIAGPSPAAAVTQPSHRAPRQGRSRHAARTPLHLARSGDAGRRAHSRSERLGSGGAAWHRRSRHSLPRTAPLFDGVPEPGAGAPTEGGASALNAIAPHTLPAASAAGLGSEGTVLVVVVPGLLALAALALAGTAVVRRRRLSSRLAR